MRPKVWNRRVVAVFAAVCVAIVCFWAIGEFM